jgi:flagellar FliJ protein
MKGLPTLIRLRQRALDALRRQLAEQEKELEALLAEDKRLAEELERERAMAAKYPQMAVFYGSFAKGVEEKQKEIRLKAREVNQKIRKTRDEITEAFGELKRFEITRDNIAAAEQETKDKQEQAALDEMALQGFRRNQPVEE